MNQWSCANCLRWSSCTYQSIDKLVHPSGSSRSHNLIEFWRFPLSIDGPVCAARWKKIIHHVSYYAIASKATLPVYKQKEQHHAWLTVTKNNRHQNNKSDRDQNVTNRDQKASVTKRDQPWPKIRFPEFWSFGSVIKREWPNVTKISWICYFRAWLKRDQSWPTVTKRDQTNLRD